MSTPGAMDGPAERDNRCRFLFDAAAAVWEYQRAMPHPTMLAAVLADTLYLYPSELAPAVAAELDVLRDDRKAGAVARFVARILALGVHEATEEEADGFPMPEYGDHFDLPYPAR